MKNFKKLLVTFLAFVMFVLSSSTLTVFAEGDTEPINLTINIIKESKVTEDPKAPKIKVSLNSNDIPIITWNKVANATGYRVYRKTSTNKKWVAVKTTSKTKFTDNKCKATAGSKVQYALKTYVKFDGKTTWSKLSKAVSVKIPDKKEYTYKIEGSSCYTYLNGKLIVRDYYCVFEEDTIITLQDLENLEYNCGVYYYYDDKYMYEYQGYSWFCYVYEVTSKGELNEIGCYNPFDFSPNKNDGSSYLSYEDSLVKFEEFRKKFRAGELESLYLQ